MMGVAVMNCHPEGPIKNVSFWFGLLILFVFDARTSLWRPRLREEAWLSILYSKRDHKTLLVSILVNLTLSGTKHWFQTLKRQLRS